MGALRGAAHDGLSATSYKFGLDYYVCGEFNHGLIDDLDLKWKVGLYKLSPKGYRWIEKIF